MLQTKSLLQHEALISFNNIGIGLKCHLLRSENVLTLQAWPQSRLAGKRKVDKGFRPDTNPSACQLSWWRVRLCPDKLTPTPQKRSPAKFGLMIQFTVISLNVITSDTSIYFYSSQNKGVRLISHQRLLENLLCEGTKLSPLCFLQLFLFSSEVKSEFRWTQLFHCIWAIIDIHALYD